MNDITNDHYGIPDKAAFNAVKKALHPGLAGKFKKSISAAKAQKTKNLYLRDDNIENLDFLKYFPNLTSLFVNSAKLKDIKGLQYTPKLDELTLLSAWETPIDIGMVGKCTALTLLDLSPKKGLSKQERPVEMYNFEAIAKLHELTDLALPALGLKDIGWIAGLKKLDDVELAQNPIADLAPLAGLNLLRELDLCQCELTDIAPLKQMPGLEILSLTDNRIGDFSPLQNLQRLKELSAENNGLTENEIEKWESVLKNVVEVYFR